MSAMRTGQLVLILLSMVLTTGCGNHLGTVTGEVTYEGAAVEKGSISFVPEDGKGPIAGGPVSAGHFVVTNLVPGPKLVQITAVREVKFARSSEEMAQMAAAQKARGDGTGLIDPADIIPPNAEGNNARVEVKPGQQKLDFALKKPADKRQRP